jgi:hypothetical protein
LIKKLNKIFNQISRREEKRREKKKKRKTNKQTNFFDVVNSETSENSDVSLFTMSEFSDVANSATSEKVFFFFFAKNLKKIKFFL